MAKGWSTTWRVFIPYSNDSFIKKRSIIQSPAYIESVICSFVMASPLAFSQTSVKQSKKKPFFTQVLISAPKNGKWFDIDIKKK